ncbi:hypothetical protein [Coleofasciculus sp. G2-EDA-02]|uniref:hypothetical protein n=1 Tax=Coleofasciculus sp. G2-EDA-02 TaxID=3069529 RepID=UPI0032FEA41C
MARSHGLTPKHAINAQHYTVARFYSRTEAENHQRFLAKWMPDAQFEVVFDEYAVTSTV